MSLRTGDMVLVCVTISRADTKLEQMGEQRVCGGTATLPEPTSVCCTSHRWGRIQLHPTQELPVAHQ